MDVFYRRQCQVPDLGFALTVLTTVVSRPTPERAIIDAFRSEGDWYLRYEFTDVIFKSASPKPRKDVEPPQMDAALNFAKATIVYRQTGGQGLAPAGGGWDLQPNSSY